MAAGTGISVPGFASPALAEGPGEDPDVDAPRPEYVTLALTGDVMTGRGVDQVLPYPGDPRLYEPSMTSALGYVSLAEEANGPIPRPADFSHVWGDALAELDGRRPDVRLVNLETAVTTSVEPELKSINYRMHPRNIPVLPAAGVNWCVLANNHVLDWQVPGLLETLTTLDDAGIALTGAGRNLVEAAEPAALPVGPRTRILVFGYGSPTSSIPTACAATSDRPGVNFLPDLSPSTIRRITRQITAAKTPGDIVVVSIH